MFRRFGLAGLILGSACSDLARADVFATLPFDGLTNNNADDTATGEGQMNVDVGNDIGGALQRDNQVRFTFINLGPNASSITDIYFDDGSLLGIAFLENDPNNVEFSQGADPPNLPGGEMADPPFETTLGFSADSDPPVEPLGVNPGERLGIVFDLMEGKTIPDVLDDLRTGALRIGIHVQGFASGGSESFINIPLPEPGTFTLCLLGAAALARRRRA